MNAPPYVFDGYDRRVGCLGYRNGDGYLMMVFGKLQRSARDKTERAAKLYGARRFTESKRLMQQARARHALAGRVLQGIAARPVELVPALSLEASP